MRTGRTLCVLATSIAALTSSCSGSRPSPLSATPSSAAAPTSVPPQSTGSAATIPQDTTTTVDPATLFDVYSTPGPYAVGVTTVVLSTGVNVELWYPAADAAAATQTYDVRDFTPPAVKALLTADIPAVVSYPGARDAVIADGKFPIVLNSHGFSGIRVGSSFLTAHLASWGVIVASPDHPSRDLYHAVGQLTPDVVTAPVDDLLGALDYVTTAGGTPGSIFEGHVDSTRVVALGHSAGGGTVLQAAADPRVNGYVSMASGVPQDQAATVTLPDKPSFFVSGTLDQIVPTSRTHDAFAAAPTPSLFWALDGVGHNGFDDFCTIGNGQGIIGIAEASGLGPFLDTQPQFRSLGQDGCLPPAVPVTTTFPVIKHAITAWILTLFGMCEGPQGLGPEVAGLYPVAVTIEQR